jgi:hypothetical protein
LQSALHPHVRSQYCRAAVQTHSTLLSPHRPTCRHGPFRGGCDSSERLSLKENFVKSGLISTVFRMRGDGQSSRWFPLRRSAFLSLRSCASISSMSSSISLSSGNNLFRRLGISWQGLQHICARSHGLASGIILMICITSASSACGSDGVKTYIL